MFKIGINLLGIFLCGSCFLLEDQKPTNDHDLTRYLDNVVTNLVNLTGKLEKDIALKNDLTQFLQSDLHQINSTLQAEKQRRQALESKVTQLEARLTSEKASNLELKAELISTKALASSLQNDLLAAKHQIDILKYELNATLVKQSNDIGNLTNKVGVLETDMDEFQNKTNKTSYFSVRNSMRLPPKGLSFSGVLENHRSVYNTSSGTFVAPYDGVYIFSLTLGVITDSFTNCYIVRNEFMNLVEAFSSVVSGYSSATTFTIVRLLKGDRITVDNCHGNGTFNAYKTSFSGILLRAD